MKAPLAILALAAPALMAQPPHTGVGSMIVPVPADPSVTGAPPSRPQPPQCRVDLILSPQQVPNSPTDNGPLVWSVTWDPSVGTGTAQVDIQYALDEWAAIVQNTTDRIANPFPITIAFSDFGAGSTLIALTTVTSSVPSGNLLSASMSFNTRYTYFLDNSPGDDSEFCPTCPPVAGVDLLTVARHELGHAVGFSQTARINA